MKSNDADGDPTRTHVPVTSGTMVSHYRIVQKIGAGGMGEVYLAEDTKLGRRVAMKFLPAHLVSDEEIKARFIRETQTIARLNHPNIVSIYDVSEFNGRPYFVMELVEGDSLHSQTHERPQPIDLIIEYAIQICQGLGEAHRAGIIHRDIKSSNIIVDSRGRIRILDFGLAAVAGDDGLTRTGTTLGTVSYMSPEQVSGKEIDHRSDLFSLGAVLYELITGRTPFKRDSEGATLKAIIEDTPEPLARYKSDVPAKLQEIVMKLLEKDKEIRYQSAEGVIADLKKLIYDSSQTGYSRITEAKSGKHRSIAWIATFAVIGVAAASYFILGKINDNPVLGDKTPVIAVFPFENLGPPEDQYFADGMTEEITSRLAGINGLGVIPRTSSTKFSESDKTLQEIGNEYGIDFVLGGSVRWNKGSDPPSVRITPRLIRVSDDRQLWANNYERALIDIFAVQENIAEEIVAQLGVNLTSSEESMKPVMPTESSMAYQYYLKALNSMRNVRRWEKTWFNAEWADSAVAYDSNFALAWALRSEAYSRLYYYYTDSLPFADHALRSAEKALELEPGLRQGFLALGYYYHQVRKDYERALHYYRKAGSENINYALLWHNIAEVQEELGRFEEAEENHRRTISVDPLNAVYYRDLARVQRRLGRFDEALASIDRAIAIEADREIYYTEKIRIVAYRSGDFEAIRSIVNEAFGNMKSIGDSIDFVQFNWWLNYYIPDLNWQPIVSEYLRRENVGEFVTSPYSLFWNSDELDIVEGYEDSLRTEFENVFDRRPNDVRTKYALFLSFTGECGRAYDLALEAKNGWLNEGEDPWSWDIARVYVNCGEYDDALTEIEGLMANRHWSTANTLKYIHWLKLLRDHPRYQALIQKYGENYGA